VAAWITTLVQIERVVSRDDGYALLFRWPPSPLGEGGSSLGDLVASRQRDRHMQRKGRLGGGPI
jgi:hypothetical protein